jgi:serine/threonine protein phosphatase 1
MARTFVIGDIHGELEMLRALLAKLPSVRPEDTLVFLGDYLDRGPRSREVLEAVRGIDRELRCHVIPLRGNHEDAWLRVIDQGWDGFLLPPQNGCLAAARSFMGGPPAALDELPTPHEWAVMRRGGFFNADHVAWLRGLPFWYEDEHGIYVHAGLTPRDGRYLHPSEIVPETAMLWTRTREFFTDYRGKQVIVGHTRTRTLPPELSDFTPDDSEDIWAGPCVIGIDTGAGSGGFLSAIELPSGRVYESR